MIKETMTKWERIEKAIRFDRTDRTPIVPLLTHTFAWRYNGMSQSEAGKNPDKGTQALYTAFTELGGFDAIYFPGVGRRNDFTLLQGPMAVRKNPQEDALVQYEEKEIMTVEDYDRILEVGWDKVVMDLYGRVWGHPPDSLMERQKKAEKQYWSDYKFWEEKHIPVFCNFSVWSPLMILSCCRSLTQLTLDLFRRPDKVAAVMDAMIDGLIQGTIKLARYGGPRPVQVVLERGSTFYISLKLFERFELPYIKKMVNAFIAEGIIPVLHLDNDWQKNLPYLKDLPKGECICELDSTTDIFKAKEILCDHICIKGDVPASLLSLGTPEQVEAYCKKLIDVVGDGGGFILSTGCNCPIDAKPENVKAMVSTAKNYLPGS